MYLTFDEFTDLVKEAHPGAKVEICKDPFGIFVTPRGGKRRKVTLTYLRLDGIMLFENDEERMLASNAAIAKFTASVREKDRAREIIGCRTWLVDCPEA